MKTLIVLTALLSSTHALASGGPRHVGGSCESLDGLFPVMVITENAEPDAVLIKYLFAKCQQQGAELEKISFGELAGRSATGICKISSSKQ